MRVFKSFALPHRLILNNTGRERDSARLPDRLDPAVQGVTSCRRLSCQEGGIPSRSGGRSGEAASEYVQKGIREDKCEKIIAG